MWRLSFVFMYAYIELCKKFSRRRVPATLSRDRRRRPIAVFSSPSSLSRVISVDSVVSFLHIPMPCLPFPVYAQWRRPSLTKSASVLSAKPRAAGSLVWRCFGKVAIKGYDSSASCFKKSNRNADFVNGAQKVYCAANTCLQKHR